MPLGPCVYTLRIKQGAYKSRLGFRRLVEQTIGHEMCGGIRNEQLLAALATLSAREREVSMSRVWFGILVVLIMIVLGITIMVRAFHVTF
jgi:hypothetical protein